MLYTYTYDTWNSYVTCGMHTVVCEHCSHFAYEIWHGILGLLTLVHVKTALL